MKEVLMEIFNAALSGVDPCQAVIRGLRREGNLLHAAGSVYALDSFDRVVVVGAGKATARMALAVEDILDDAIHSGTILVKYGHMAGLRIIEQIEADHPVPDKAGMRGTQKILDLVGRAEKTLVICLLSGGGSALLVKPLPGITLADKQETTDLFLKAGATITELNSVRKHLSAIKGGRLAQAACQGTMVTLILSDVIGDDLEVIASGPTVPDSSTFTDAAGVIKKYKLKSALPASVTACIERGIAGREPETPKKGDPCFFKPRNVVVGGIAQALFAARNKARTLGYVSELISTDIQGEARDVARFLAKMAIKACDKLKPGERRCLLFGGETTVTVSGNGRGGRNQELALAFAREIAGISGITMLSAGTDGTDGPTDAAGALVDGSTVQKARQSGISPEAYLENNDSYTFFQKIDFISQIKHHVMTGPTGTNVMDVQIILLEG